MTYIAIDVHQHNSTFAYLIPATGETGKRTVHTTRQRYELVLSGLPKPWVVAVEATRQSPAVCAWLRELDAAGDSAGKLAMLEEQKTMPLGAVWDYYCQRQSVPLESEWPSEVRRHEAEVLNVRRP